MTEPRAFVFCVVPVLVGLAVAVALQLGVILPRVGTGSPDLNRMMAVGKLLNTSLSEEPTLVFVGDSVTVEGIDAGIVKAGAPAGWRVLNLGINGCDRAELDVILPKVAAAKPRAVCIVLRPLSIAYPPDVEVDSSYAYNLGGFAEAWPAGWMTPYPPGVPQDKYEKLVAGKFEAQLHFRTALQALVNSKLRGAIRRGVRAVGSEEWRAPFNMTESIGGELLDRHVRVLAEELRIGVEGGTKEHEADLERLVMYLQSQGVVPILVSSPTHPGLREAFGATGARLREVALGLAERCGGVYADATLLLDESGFADGQHLNQKGRELLSRFIAGKLPAAAVQ